MLKKADASLAAGEEYFEEAGPVIVRDMTEGEAEALVKTLGEQSFPAALAQESQQLITESGLIVGGIPLCSDELTGVEPRYDEGALDRGGKHG